MEDFIFGVIAWIIVGIGCLAIVALAFGVLYFLYSWCRKQKTEMAAALQEYKAPAHYKQFSVACTVGESNVQKGVTYGLWMTADTMNLLEANDAKVRKRSALYGVIPIKDIQHYKIKGEEHYVSTVSGGGGGGISLGGAVVGGMIAGSTGAVIGSRKKVKAIKTSVKRIDGRETELFVKHGDRIVRYCFAGADLYAFLTSRIADKEYSVLKANQGRQFKTEQSTSEKLKDLKQMLEDGLITQTEFEQKKAELLSEM